MGGVGLDSVVRGFGSVIEATTLKMAEHERVMRSEGPGIEGTETHCARGPFDRTLSFSGPCENNAAKDILSTGCLWRAIPKDLPPKSSVYDYFDLWTYDGTLERIHYALYEQCRERAQREASPTAAIIDSQSVKSAEKGGRALIRTGTMRARRSRARSGTFWSTH